MNKVDKLAEKFYQTMRDNRDNYYNLDLKGWEVSVLDGLVALAMDHPAVQEIAGPSVMLAGKRFRDWCQSVYVAMGMTEEEARLIDALREPSQQQGGVSVNSRSTAAGGPAR